MSTRRIVDYWNELVEGGPGAPSLIGPDGITRSRGEIDDRAQVISHRFTQGGVAPRRALVVCVPNGFEWLAAFVACLKSKIVVVFADHGTRENDLRQMVQAIGAAGLWDGERLRTTKEEKVRYFRDQDVALGKFTSGSTGLPKCQFFKDSEMIADGRRTLEAFGMLPSDIILGVVPWGHSYGLGSIVIPFMILGARLTWLQSPLPSDIERSALASRPTVFPSVPTIIKVLSRSDCDPHCLASVRVLVTAGSRLDPSIARAFHARYGIAPLNLYGSSETGSICFDPTGDCALEGSGVGKVLPGVSVSVARDGRLMVSSDAVYTHGNRRFDEEGRGACLLGDYGEIDACGNVWIRSRAKGFVKVGEKRVGLADVERRLEALPEVTAAHALAIESNGEVVLAAAIETRRGRKLVAGDIRASVAAKFRPAIWIALEEFPVTERGKPDSKKIRQLLSQALEARDGDRRSDSS